MELALFPVDRLYAGHLVYSGDHAAAVLDAYRRFASHAPDDVMSSVALIRAPDLPSVPEIMRGRLTVRVRVSYLGSEADGAQLVAPLRAAAPTLMDVVQERPYREFAAIDPSPPEPSAIVSHFEMLSALSPAVLDAILDVVGPVADTTINMVDLRQLGGKLSDRVGSPNAVGNRDAAFVIQTISGISADGTSPRPEAGLELMDRLKPWLSERKIPNFFAPSDATVERTRRGFDDPTYRRLQSVKAKYDPTNMFRLNFNIPPSQNLS
jgi:hypothetical protein